MLATASEPGLAAAAAPHDFAVDIAAIARIDAVPTILDIVCRHTGTCPRRRLGFVRRRGWPST